MGVICLILAYLEVWGFRGDTQLNATITKRVGTHSTPLLLTLDFSQLLLFAQAFIFPVVLFNFLCIGFNLNSFKQKSDAAIFQKLRKQCHWDTRDNLPSWAPLLSPRQNPTSMPRANHEQPPPMSPTLLLPSLVLYILLPSLGWSMQNRRIIFLNGWGFLPLKA